MSKDYPFNLVMVVPGKDEKETLQGLLTTRARELDIKDITFKILVHPRRDPGCFLEAPDILREYINQAEYALVFLDHEGCGRENKSVQSLTSDLEKRLAANGWKGRAHAIIIKPELESWIWGMNPEGLRDALGWRDHSGRLVDWLEEEGLWKKGDHKPERPKEAMVNALREVRVIRSSSIYRQVAETVSLDGCKDPAFNKLKKVLGAWFPTGEVNKENRR